MRVQLKATEFPEQGQCTVIRATEAKLLVRATEYLHRGNIVILCRGESELPAGGQQGRF